MAVSRIKEWVQGEILTATELNAEFDNVNQTGVAWPLTENVSAAGYEISNAKLTTLKQLQDNVVCMDNYADFASAISGIGNAVTTLLIASNVNVTANATVPSTLTLWFMGQGKLTVSVAVTCTINGPIVTGARQIFAGTGTVALTDNVKVSHVYPQWWGATGDGVTDDTAAIQAAVTAAYAIEAMLHWTTGSFLTTSSISHLHDVRHTGPGYIGRAGRWISLVPKWAYEINLYVATTGSDTNDGLSASEPMLTAQHAGDTIYNYDYGDVIWKINFAAGTYQASTAFSKPFPTPQRVQFLGVPKSNGVEPTTIFQSPGGASKFGLYFQMQCNVWIEDIKFIDYYASVSPNASNLCYGLLVQSRSDLYSKNVWADNCDNGIGVWHLSQGRIEAGVIANCGNGVVSLSNCIVTTGYNGSAADITGATGTTITDCSVGCSIRECSASHVDYTYFDGITNMALYLSQFSRCNNVSSTYNNCLTAVRCESGSYWLENPGDENTFTSNTNDLLIRSGSMTGGTNSGEDLYGPALIDNDTSFYSTSSLTDVTIYTRTITARELGTRGRSVSLSLWGDTTGTNDTKTVTVTLGATTLLTATIGATVTDYKIDIELVQRISTGSPAQRVMTVIYAHNTAPQVAYTSTAIDMAADIDLVVKHKVANASDANRINNIHLELVH